MTYRKYNARKVETPDGIFDSRKEHKRWQELKLLQETGEIRDLKRQESFLLIPSQKDEKGRTIERPVKYVADFTYRDLDNKLHVEDSKGMKTTDYILKRKMMLHLLGIRIEEV